MHSFIHQPRPISSSCFIYSLLPFVAPCPVSLFLQAFGCCGLLPFVASCAVGLIRSYVLLPYLLPLSLPVLCLYSFSCPAAVACCRLCFPFCLYPLSCSGSCGLLSLSLPVLCAYSLICSFAVPAAVVAPCSLSLFLQLFGILWPAVAVASCAVSLSSQASGSLPAVPVVSCASIFSGVPDLFALSLPVFLLSVFKCLYLWLCASFALSLRPGIAHI